MRRVYLLCLSLLCAGTVLACSDTNAPPPPSLAVVANACNSVKYPNYGGIWAVTLEPDWQQADSSVSADNWLGLSGKNLTAWVWRDWASSPGNQYYCVDTTASYTKLTWFTGNPPGPYKIGFLPGPGPNARAIQAFQRGTARPYVIYGAVPTIRDTATVVVVP